MRSFKSVGLTGTQVNDAVTASETTRLAIGIVTPLSEGRDDEGVLAMSYDVGQQLKNNFRDLLMTNWGERVCMYDYGANLQPLVTEYENGRELFEQEAIARISAAVQKHMPYVELDDFDSEKVESESGFGLGVLAVRISYSIPRAKVAKSWIELRFSLS